MQENCAYCLHRKEQHLEKSGCSCKIADSNEYCVCKKFITEYEIRSNLLNYIDIDEEFNPKDSLNESYVEVQRCPQCRGFIGVSHGLGIGRYSSTLICQNCAPDVE